MFNKAVQLLVDLASLQVKLGQVKAWHNLLGTSLCMQKKKSRNFMFYMLQKMLYSSSQLCISESYSNLIFLLPFYYHLCCKLQCSQLNTHLILFLLCLPYISFFIYKQYQFFKKFSQRNARMLNNSNTIVRACFIILKFTFLIMFKLPVFFLDSICYTR